MNDNNEVEPIDWPAFGHGVLLIIRVGLMITSVVAIWWGFSDFSDAHWKGGYPQQLASMRIGGAILVGTGLCSFAFICSQFPSSFRSHDDSHPKV